MSCVPSQNYGTQDITQSDVAVKVVIIIIIIIKNEKIRVTLCENAAGALYIVNKNDLKPAEKSKSSESTSTRQAATTAPHNYQDLADWEDVFDGKVLIHACMMTVTMRNHYDANVFIN